SSLSSTIRTTGFISLSQREYALWQVSGSFGLYAIQGFGGFRKTPHTAVGPIRVGTGDGAARAFAFPDTLSFRRGLKVRSITTLPNPVGVNERPERGKPRHLKTDSAKTARGAVRTAILPAGMMGDRADVIFAAPEEINKTIESQC